METITTSAPEKLPEAVRALLVETRPLPPGVTFFEQRFTVAALAGRLVLGLALMALCVLMIPISIAWFLDSLRHATVYDTNHLERWMFVAGAVLGVAGWILVASIQACLALGRKQKAGERTRYGIFLTPEALVWRSYFDTTVIPPANFRGVESRVVRYMGNHAEKSFTLPMEWIGPADPEGAIRSWSRSQTPPALPKPPTVP